MGASGSLRGNAVDRVEASGRPGWIHVNIQMASGRPGANVADLEEASGRPWRYRRDCARGFRKARVNGGDLTKGFGKGREDGDVGTWASGGSARWPRRITSRAMRTTRRASGSNSP